MNAVAFRCPVVVQAPVLAAKGEYANLTFLTTQQKTLGAEFFKPYRSVARTRRPFVVTPAFQALSGVARPAKRFDKTPSFGGSGFAELASLRAPLGGRTGDRVCRQPRALQPIEAA